VFPTGFNPEEPVRQPVKAMQATTMVETCPRTVIADHFSNVRQSLSDVPVFIIERMVDVFREARDRGSFIYIAGNGGSSSTASHWVNDLGKATKRSGCPPMKVMCLSDNTSWFSALANDEGYERAFAGQLENFAMPGDVLVCISASGNSPNLVRAVELARARGVTTVGLLGFDGGALKSLVDVTVCVCTEKGAYERVEDVHSVICHSVTRSLIADRPEPG
jgi:D-sedoheptulose 7-phosphate isomerase